MTENETFSPDLTYRHERHYTAQHSSFHIILCNSSKRDNRNTQTYKQHRSLPAGMTWVMVHCFSLNEKTLRQTSRMVTCRVTTTNLCSWFNEENISNKYPPREVDIPTKTCQLFNTISFQVSSLWSWGRSSGGWSLLIYEKGRQCLDDDTHIGPKLSLILHAQSCHCCKLQ